MSSGLKENTKGKSKVDRKRVLTILIVVGAVVVAVLTGVMVRWLQSQGQDGSESATIEGLPTNPFVDEVVESQELADQGDYEAANESVSEKLESSNENSVRYELYIQQGINYENQEKYDEAINSYREAEKISQEFAVYESLGRVYELKGDNQSAIDAYKKAITLIDTEDPMVDSDRAYLEGKVKSLGGAL